MGRQLFCRARRRSIAAARNLRVPFDVDANYEMTLTLTLTLTSLYGLLTPNPRRYNSSIQVTTKINQVQGGNR
jgi:hypothetical protein